MYIANCTTTQWQKKRIILETPRNAICVFVAVELLDSIRRPAMENMEKFFAWDLVAQVANLIQ